MEESTVWENWVLSITKDTVNEKYDHMRSLILTNGEFVLWTLRGYEETTRLRYLANHIFSLNPSLNYTKHFCSVFVRNIWLLQTALRYGYIPPKDILAKVFEFRHVMRISERLSDSFRLLFEHGISCIDEGYRDEYPWIFDIYNEVATRRENCARACIAVAGVSKRRRHQRDVLSIVTKLVWESRKKDEWLK
jgi:hypothetical protein